MSLSLGERLKIRSTVHVAGEPIPNFWPMRTFIHHNPLHDLETLPFPEAVKVGERLFHARGFLPRTTYQRYLAEGRIDQRKLETLVDTFVAVQEPFEGIDLKRLLLDLMTKIEQPVALDLDIATAADVRAVCKGESAAPNDAADPADPAELRRRAMRALRPGRPVYETVDALFGSEIGDTLDELVIKSCLDFFDEGQSSWQMPGREQGFFTAWSAVARRNLRLFLRGLHIKQILAADDTPEGIVAYVMRELGVPEDDWLEYFTGELTRLHGWSGFIRWRNNAKHYYWGRHYPADLIDFLAIRLVLGLALLREHGRRWRQPITIAELTHFVEQRPAEAWLRHELHGGGVLPAMAHAVEDALARGSERSIGKLLPRYIEQKRADEARRQAGRFLHMRDSASLRESMGRLEIAQLERLLRVLRQFESEEGFIWLRAMEAHYMDGLVNGLRIDPPPPREKRPFAQMFFCIDVRSERIRRHLEAVGDYQTYGIAGFFGVPVSFIGLGKGSETHLCPVVVTPKNLVLELNIARNAEDTALVTVFEEAFHDLKGSVLSPYITVEAIGLLFGFDMFGKSLAPLRYNRWRARMLEAEKPPTRLLLDKLTLEQADSILRAVQRAVIVRAIGKELSVARERITDETIRELRETALEHRAGPTVLSRQFGLDEAAEQRFIQRLRSGYMISRSHVQIQMERLGRIGFSLEEQVLFVDQALRSIGLTTGFSRFVLLCGHGSVSDNNPYESALDCGACGGNHGVVSARVLAQMANKPNVRNRLRQQGIDIPDDTWFCPALHNTATDEIEMHDLELLPPSHLVYVERMTNGFRAASRLSAAERVPTLDENVRVHDPAAAARIAHRNSTDWSQVRPEWGLSRNAGYIIGRRHLTEHMHLEGRIFLQSYDYRLDPKGRLLESIMTGPLVVGQWINMEHYFSAVDNERYGSGSKAYHNVAGRFAVITGNLSDLRTGLPSQTVLKDGEPYHEPLRMISVIEAPFAHALRAIENVVKIKQLVYNGWIRMVIADPETGTAHIHDEGEWHQRPFNKVSAQAETQESMA